MSDDRQCTCHPDDNPPVPCAKQYALTECRELERLRAELSAEKQANTELQLALGAKDYDLTEVRGELAAARAESALQPNYSCEHDGCAMQEGSRYQEQAREYVDEYYRMKNELATLKALLREVLDQCRETDKMLWDNQLYKRLRAALGDEP